MCACMCTCMSTWPIGSNYAQTCPLPKHGDLVPSLKNRRKPPSQDSFHWVLLWATQVCSYCSYQGTNPALSRHTANLSLSFLSWPSSTVFALLVPKCMPTTHAHNFSPTSLFLYPTHKPMNSIPILPYLHNQPFEDENTVPLLLSPTG